MENEKALMHEKVLVIFWLITRPATQDQGASRCDSNKSVLGVKLQVVQPRPAAEGQTKMEFGKTQKTKVLERKPRGGCELMSNNEAGDANTWPVIHMQQGLEVTTSWEKHLVMTPHKG